MKTNRRSLLGALLAPLFLLACGGDEADGSATATSPIVDEPAATCELVDLVEVAVVSDPGALKAVLRRAYGDSPPMEQALVAAISPLPKEQYPIAVYSASIRSSSRVIDLSGRSTLGTQVWSFGGFSVDLQTEAYDGIHETALPIIARKDQSLSRAELGADVHQRISVRCGSNAGAPSSTRTIVSRGISDVSCADVKRSQEKLCARGCGDPSNVSSAMLLDEPAIEYRYTATKREQRYPVGCHCDDGTKFKVTCNGGAD